MWEQNMRFILLSIYVMNEGKITGEFSAEEATQEKIMSTILKSDCAAVN